MFIETSAKAGHNVNEKLSVSLNLPWIYTELGNIAGENLV
jgi:hypothetical protein